jgi:hypothetical protein
LPGVRRVGVRAAAAQPVHLTLPLTAAVSRRPFRKRSGCNSEVRPAGPSWAAFLAEGASSRLRGSLQRVCSLGLLAYPPKIARGWLMTPPAAWARRQPRNLLGPQSFPWFWLAWVWAGGCLLSGSDPCGSSDGPSCLLLRTVKECPRFLWLPGLGGFS